MTSSLITLATGLMAHQCCILQIDDLAKGANGTWIYDYHVTMNQAEGEINLITGMAVDLHDETSHRGYHFVSIRGTAFGVHCLLLRGCSLGPICSIAARSVISFC